MFTKQEEEGLLVVEMVLRNLPPVAPFVVSCQWPLVQDEAWDACRLNQNERRPAQHRAQVFVRQCWFPIWEQIAP